MENREVARILRETAQLLEIDGAMIGRYRSYEKAAELLGSIPDSVEELSKDRAKLMELPGIGDGMADHIAEILKTGDYSLRQKLLKKYPATILDLLELQSLGPKKVALLWKTFKAGTVEQVEKIAREGKLRDLAGFGEKSEENILKAIEVFKKSSGRFAINVASEEAEKLVSHIRAFGKPIEAVTPAGSLRRGKETVGDLDLLVTLPSEKYKPKTVESIAQHILSYPEIAQQLAHGENKVSFLLKSGMQVDVRILEKESYGAALLYFTGSKEHNVTLRGRANKMGLTLNEYALATLKGERPVARATEEEIYAKLGLDFIPPELRENTGEIEAAAEHRLPDLVDLSDIRGDMQMHTTASDGRNSIEEMALAAKDLGYEYISLTDHSKAVTVANGLDEKRTLEQIKKIHAANAKNLGIHVLASSEVDVLKNGKLDLDDEVLAQLDVVLVSIHSYMNLDRAEMTDRLLAAVENPYTQIIGHPTGRLVLHRDAYAYDMERVLDAAHKHGVVMECNASPERLDLKDTHLRMAKERGVKIVISTDAHATRGLQVMRYGVQMARRGWLEKTDVINTLSLEKMLAGLREKPGSAANGKQRAAAASARASSKPRRNN
ncbi:MAG TPA: DNA polymerase/3'-5' exonuclease PolX [Candidatus Sulfotelmatobacter sp.]|jgi:DNA polymerase (family 10)|nr:DNA polymerase/3'-5' exonuclease PolX [Candidatus Sulfotelmatobacter sp.]